MKLQPRDYQVDCIAAINRSLCDEPDVNPCVEAPTASGKSLMMAMLIESWTIDSPKLRVCILAHRTELVIQNARELEGYLDGVEVGIYAASEGRRDNTNILYAQIDSIYDKHGQFAPWDVLIVDEAHRIPTKGHGKYRQFIDGCRRWNSTMPVVGFTATPERMDGPICHRDHVLNKLVYSIPIGRLIEDGHLCRVRAKVKADAPKTTSMRVQRGDFVTSDLSKTYDKQDVIDAALDDFIFHFRNEKRNKGILFCIDSEHCKHVKDGLVARGISCEMITGKTPHKDRKRIINDFEAGRYETLANIAVFTEGFNVKSIDCVGLFTSTKSRTKYKQMIGRGMRTHPTKSECLVLDYGHNIDEHGPIDEPIDMSVRTIKCRGCGDIISARVGACPHCGEEIPKQVREETAEADERERKIHDIKAAKASIMSEPEWLDIDDVTINLHRKEGSPDSIRVCYRCGSRVIPEWVCLDHDGYARQKSIAWCVARSLDWTNTMDAFGDMFACEKIKAITQAILVARDGKFYRIHDYILRPNIKRGY